MYLFLSLFAKESNQVVGAIPYIMREVNIIVKRDFLLM